MKKRITSKIKTKLQKLNIIHTLLGLLAFCFVVVTIGAYASFLLGSDYFLLPIDKIANSETVAHLISGLLFLINVFYMLYICSGLKIKQAIYASVLYLPIYLTGEALLSGNIILYSVIPAIYVLITAIINKKSDERLFKSIIRVALRLAALFLLLIVYERITAPVKLGMFPEFKAVINISVIAKVFYSIDAFALLTIISIFVGGDKNGWRLVSALFPEDPRSNNCDSEDTQSIVWVESLPKWQRVVFMLVLFSFQIFQIIVALVVAKIGNAAIECTLILFSYLLSSRIIRRRWHTKPSVCTVLTALVFYIASRFSVPVKYSMYFPLITGLLVTYGLYRASIYTDFYNRHRDFDVETCSLENLNERCRLVGLSLEDTQLCGLLFFEKISAKEAIEKQKHTMTIQSLRNKKSLLKKKLNEPNSMP